MFAPLRQADTIEAQAATAGVNCLTVCQLGGHRLTSAITSTRVEAGVWSPKYSSRIGLRRARSEKSLEGAARACESREDGRDSGLLWGR